MEVAADFLRHEYTWSRHTISGNTGLGVISSSTPKDKLLIQEMEKIASMAEADGRTGMEVELLMYSEEAGFVKLAVKPAPAAEDQRQNKKVYLYQTDQMEPSLYCIPRGSWQEEKQVLLPALHLEEDWDFSKNIFVKYRFMDRLPDLFRAVFWCVFRGGNHLAFQAPWPREEYASASREIMYAIHSILPKTLRKNAGYASYGCGMNRRSAFFFIDPEDMEQVDSNEIDLFDIGSQEYRPCYKEEDALETFFYEKLATIFWQDEKKYDEFIEKMDELLENEVIEPKRLKQIQWIFLDFCLQNMMDLPPLRDIMELFPPLFYLTADSEDLMEIKSNLMAYYHALSWKKEDYEKYLRILAEGMSKKGEESIFSEMNWALLAFREKNPSIMKDALNQLKKNHKAIYSKFMTRYLKEEGHISQEYYRNNCGNLEEISRYIEEMDLPSIASEARDQWMLRAVEIVNEDVFFVKNYEDTSRIAALLDREKQWQRVLKGFLKQLCDRCQELEDAQLDAACQIENIYESMTGITEDSALKEEKAARSCEPESGEDEINDENKTPSGEQDVNGHFLPFFIRGLPYGFLTGCILYLLNYGFVIGHWKISMGVGGMWLILMLNYAIERIEAKKKDGYRLWQALGLCLVEGYITQVIAWVFLPKIFRIYFFLILGFVTVCIQCIYGLILLKKREEEEEV